MSCKPNPLGVAWNCQNYTDGCMCQVCADRAKEQLKLNDGSYPTSRMSKQPSCKCTDVNCQALRFWTTAPNFPYAPPAPPPASPPMGTLGPAPTPSRTLPAKPKPVRNLHTESVKASSDEKLPPMRCATCDHYNEYVGKEHLVDGVYYCRNHIQKAKDKRGTVAAETPMTNAEMHKALADIWKTAL